MPTMGMSKTFCAQISRLSLFPADFILVVGVCLPLNIWIVLENWRVLQSVFLFGDRSIQASQSFNPSLFPNNMFTTSSTVMSMSCAIIIHFRRLVLVMLTAMTSLTEVAAVTFEKRLC